LGLRLLKNFGLACLTIYLTAVGMAGIFLGAVHKDQSILFELAGQQTDAATLDKIRKAYKLEGSFWEQWGHYAKDLLPFSLSETHTGIKVPDFRESLYRKVPVTQLLAAALPNTLLLAFAASALAMGLGMLLGVFSARNAGKFWEKGILALAASGMALPSFFAAVLISWSFGFLWHAYTGLKPWGNLYEINDFTGNIELNLANLILPAITLGIRPLAVVMQLTRNACLELEQQPFVRTAFAKGLTPYKVWWKHILRNALSPVFTAMTTWLGGMLAGAVFVEFVFGWDGLGKLMVDALQKKDFPVIVGGVTLITAMFTLLHWLTQLGQVALDPRAGRS
jgi:peptide/nickel transport system permease protein